MDDSALKEALQRLLAHGNAAGDRNMMKLADSKKPQPAAEVCSKCGAPMSEGDDPSMPDKCPKCGYEKSDAEDGGDSDMAALMEQGSQE